MFTLTDISENIWGTFLKTRENLRQSAFLRASLEIIDFCVETGLPLDDYNKKFVNKLLFTCGFTCLKCVHVGSRQH